MNKKSKKRAFFVCAILCVFYVVVMFRLPEKLSMTRTFEGRAVPSRSSMVPAAEAARETDSTTAEEENTTETALPPREQVAGREITKEPPETSRVPKNTDLASGEGDIEPSLLIAVPIVCSAMKERWVEKDSLIFTKKDAYNNVTWKKPIEILRDHDEDGLRSILNTIGRKRVVEFMKKEGMSVGSDLNPEDIILGKGYRVDKQRLLSIYERHVGNSCDEIFPFSLKQQGIAKSTGGFYFIRGRETSKESARVPEEEWMMPNLANVPIRVAIEKLSAHTSRIKVQGSGHVMNQSPKPFERLRGESECFLQGRTSSE